MPKIIVDAGHGGYDNGAVYNGRREKDDNLALALAVGEALMEKGLEVEFTRVEDIYQAPVEKAQIANRADGDFLVSIHRNSSPTPNTYSGVQTLVYNDRGLASLMANNINQEMAEVGFQNLGISERQNLAVLRRSDMPAVLVEAGFINTDEDNRLLDARFDATAQAIADGIIGTLLQTGELELEDVEGPGREVYRVQTGLFRNRENAERMADQLRRMGYDVAVEMFRDLYAVKVGERDDLDDATELERELKRLGYDTLIVSK
ncbi:MAG: N-acetylmuramoyl-L-alanine amidase [Lachnospiraceae bacterium]|nr:N-acetylmuramoyl-L-alanine amidase [Lachnospiraceae bacterium]